MSTAAAASETRAEDATEPIVRVAIDLPKDLADWLEREALALKQRTGASRASKSSIVAELVRRQREKGGTE